MSTRRRQINEPPAGAYAQRNWVRGYQAGLYDVKEAFERGGEEAALQWIKDNLIVKDGLR
jgi:hypothetical protein